MSSASFFVIVWVFATQQGQVTSERTEYFWKQFATEEECLARANEGANTVRLNGDDKNLIYSRFVCVPIVTDDA